MGQYDFTLTFRLVNIEESPEKYVDQLGAAGCNDALIGIGKLGSISLNFNRESKSALKAVASAIRDVRAVIPDATLIEATPDFVGMTDIADIYGTTRQYIRKMVTSQSRSFPEPVHEGNPSLWHLADVLSWINVHEPEKFDKGLFELAKLTMQINSCKAFLKASVSSGVSVSFSMKNPRREAGWASLIHSALGDFTDAASNTSFRQTDKKTHAV